MADENNGNGRKKDWSANWFKVSRRIVESSTWARCSSDALKMLVLLMERSQSPMNPEPGYIRVGSDMLGVLCGFDPERARKALAELTGADPQSGHSGLPTLVEVPGGGGYYFTAFDDYHPGAKDRKENLSAVRADAGRKGGQVTQAKYRAARATGDEPEDEGGPI